MKTKTIFCITLAAGLLLAGCASEKTVQRDQQAKLAAQAKITKDEATATALNQVPNGTIKDSELEMENGKLQWSFDIATPNSKEITEVNIDAKTGTVISMQQESAAGEASEAAKENDGEND